MRLAAVSLLFVSLLLAPTGTHAQFWDKMTNPQMPVSVQHPPGLGLQVNKVAFGQVTGEAAEQFVESLTERFVRAQVEVMERQQIEALLAEHNFSLSGHVDSASASEMGKILGPTVLLFVKVPRYAYKQNQWTRDQMDGGVVRRFYHRKTEAFARGSIRAVDLASGRIFAAQTLEANPAKEVYLVNEGYPEYPSELELLDRAMSEMVGQAHRLFMPYVEREQVYFFDDKDCNLKTAHALMKGGSIDAALQQSIANVETCKSLAKPKEKALWHAYHNLGMCYFAKGELEKALESLNQAQGIKVSDIATEAVATVMHAKAEAEKMRQVEERMALEESIGAKKRAEAEKARAEREAPAAEASAPQASKAPGATRKKTTTAKTEPTQPPTPAGSVEDRMQRLDNMFNKGLITKPEYDKKKAELLKEL